MITRNEDIYIDIYGNIIHDEMRTSFRHEQNLNACILYCVDIPSRSFWVLKEYRAWTGLTEEEWYSKLNQKQQQAYLLLLFSGDLG